LCPRCVPRSYRIEFYPTYDYKAIGVAAHDKAQ
jgi:hypothetical protein